MQKINILVKKVRKMFGGFKKLLYFCGVKE
jgi:hypothetical protein